METGKRYYSLVVFAALGGVSTAAAQPGVLSKVHAESATLEKLHHTRDALSAVTELADAVEVADKIVAPQEGHGEIAAPEDLLEVARIQAALGEHAAAEESYLRVIDMREQQHGIFSAALIAPYHGLGRTYIGAGRFDDALLVLQHARSISHRNFGLFNLKQLDLIDDMTRAHLESGDTWAARALQVERLEKAIRHFGAESPELVPFYRHLGDYYYRRLGDRYANLPAHFRAHDEYSKALEISSAVSGDSSPASLDLLRRMTLAEMHFRHRPPARDRLAAALDGAAEISADERGLSLAVLGDWALRDGDRPAAERYYAEAYRVLAQSADVDADDFFAQPMMLDFAPPPDGVAGAARFPPWAWGTIELAFDVSAAGRATGVRIVAAEPRIEDLESDYMKRISEAHFRPSLDAGRPAARTDVTYAHRFRYYVKD